MFGYSVQKRKKKLDRKKQDAFAEGRRDLLMK